MKSVIRIFILPFSLLINCYPAASEELIDRDSPRESTPTHSDGKLTLNNTGLSNTDLSNTSASIESLSPELRALLSKEMVAIQQGMMAVIPAYVSGNWSEIEQIARQIKNSYILKQSLTDHQLHELHNSLPEGFIKQDQHFHYLSGMLEHAASNKKTELVGFYFSKMSESCVSCHSQYATHRFPALTPASKATERLH
ncbi:MAG: hypothetical protein KUG71_13155 [Porticoccaceae bacterium]|nr:hypothetical protein [Porticoccaceae bacterium]